MELLPGLNSELIENIIAYRQLEDINNRAEIAEIVPFEELQELSPWVGNATSNFYSIYAYFDPQQANENTENQERPVDELDFVAHPITEAFMETIEVAGFNELPRVLRVDPYGVLPDSAPSRLMVDEYNFR